ncbi:MAG: hypothetical protein HN576_06880 [Bacteriovoracaceae bacterium]|jgi:hypothetical protein|nr:hypothetical protein [Bacteriovoracaceae bacterium]
MFHFKLFLKLYLVSTILLSAAAYSAAPKSMTLKKKTLAIYTPHVINPKYFSFEFGFVTEKKIQTLNYNFNAFAKILIAEEFFSTASNLRAGAIGIKTGLFLPTQSWIPLLIEMAIGYAKTSLHETPWLGDRRESEEDSELLLFEAGAIYRVSHTLLLRVVYQINNLHYFKRHTFFSVGFNF